VWERLEVQELRSRASNGTNHWLVRNFWWNCGTMELL